MSSFKQQVKSEISKGPNCTKNGTACPCVKSQKAHTRCWLHKPASAAVGSLGSHVVCLLGSLFLAAEMQSIYNGVAHVSPVRLAGCRRMKGWLYFLSIGHNSF